MHLLVNSRTRFPIAEMSPQPEVERNRLLQVAELLGWQGGDVLTLVLKCRVRAVADREARPGLK